MIGVDTQILVYAHRRDSLFHDRALAALIDLARSGQTWTIPWPCVHEFLSTVTRLTLWKPPTTPERALAAVFDWTKSPRLVFISEAHDHLRRLSDLIIPARITGPRVHDARIAAICLAHGVKPLWTADRDFSRFPQLKTHNPLVG